MINAHAHMTIARGLNAKKTLLKLILNLFLSAYVRRFNEKTK
jgi:hypothetical protein